MDVALENLIDEYRRCKAAMPLNLSGKRTECVAADRGVRVRLRIFSFFGAADKLVRFF